MSEHSLLSPSSAKRWRRCPGSLWLGKNVKDKQSDAAAEGTAAHALGAHLFLNRKTVVAEYGMSIEYKDVDSNGNEVEVTYYPSDEMVDHMKAYAAELWTVVKGAASVYIENKLDLSDVFGVDGQVGTADVGAYFKSDRRLVVGDLKYGVRVPVVAKNNDQLLCYAAGLLVRVEGIYGEGAVDTIDLYIFQPRNGGTSKWSINIGDLRKFIAEVRVDALHAAEAYNCDEYPEGAFHPSPEACLYCKCTLENGAHCVAREAAAEQALEVQFDDLTTVQAAKKKVGELTNARLGMMLPVLDDLSKLIGELWGEAFRRLEAGDDVPGFKLVLGKAGNRKWKDEIEAETVLKSMRIHADKMYKQSIESPTKMEKLLEKSNPRKWKRLLPLIERSDPKPTIATVDDPRPAIYSEMFEDETGGDIAAISAKVVVDELLEVDELLGDVSVEDELLM